MQASFFLGYLIPAAVGLLLIGFYRLDFCHPLVKSAIFLIAQVVIMRHYNGTMHYSAQFMVLAILAGYAAFAILAEDSRTYFERVTATIFFVAYLLYWVLEKYALPLGWINSVLEHLPVIVHAFPELSAKTSERLSLLSTALQSWLIDPPVAMVGLSYIGFKFIHFFVDFRAEEIKKPKFLEFMNWMFFFPSIIAGPMMRFQEWQRQREVPAVNLDEIVDGAKRILLGLFMKLVLADSIHNLTIAGMTEGALSLASFWQLALAACSYTVYLYWDFAGYSHIAIGMARFWGIKLPENFNAPYRSRNLAEFWNRWHITLSLILRDYLFYPISLYLQRFPQLKRYPIVSIVVPPLVTFLLAGIWHGAGIGFVIFGTLHGIGLGWVSLIKYYKKKFPFYLWWNKSKAAYLVSVFITYLYVSFAFVFFCLSKQKLMVVWHNLLGVDTMM